MEQDHGCARARAGGAGRDGDRAENVGLIGVGAQRAEPRGDLDGVGVCPLVACPLVGGWRFRDEFPPDRW
ncbi:hypothetical protein [Nocardia sp. NPDC058705]|uniref:hypothetical protein n=1 Tax=Nocardia sp. NPDC058705 TaxID=3346609 RepID=UPI003677C845